MIGRLVKKTLYVGAFAFIIGNFNNLAGILFHSFAGLGLVASGSTLTETQFLQPGHLAKVGVDAAQPIMAQISDLTGFPEVFANLDVISVLFLAWLVLVSSFFVLAVQLYCTLIEFKLTTLAGVVLVPVALCNKTAFLAERVLGNGGREGRKGREGEGRGGRGKGRREEGEEAKGREEGRERRKNKIKHKIRQ